MCVLLLSLFTLFTTVPSVKATGGTLYVSPASQSVGPAGSTVTYQIKMANMDPFNGWDIMVNSTDTGAINATDFSIAGNLMQANYSQTPREFVHCVNNVGTGCGVADGPGIVHSSALIFAPAPMSAPVSGLLFTITYKAFGGPSTTIGIFNDLIVNGAEGANAFFVEHAVSNSIYGKGELINIDFTWEPLVPIQGDPVLFNASKSSDPNAGRIVSYSWNFGDGNITYTANPTIQHVFKRSEGRPLSILLFVTDNLGFKNLKTKALQGVQRPFHDLLASGINVSPGDSILAGTVLTIEALVVDNGTFPETGFNVSVSVEGKLLGTAGFTGRNLTRGGTWTPQFKWPTFGLAPGTYEIDSFVPPLTNSTGQVIEKTVSNNMAVHIVRIITPFQASFIPFTMPEFIGLIITVLAAVVVARGLVQRAQLKRRRLSEELA